MSHVGRGDTVTDAWIQAVICLNSVNREQFTLVVDVDNPSPEAASFETMEALDALQTREDLHRDGQSS